MLLSWIKTFPTGGIYELQLNAEHSAGPWRAAMQSARLHSIGVRRAHLVPRPAHSLDFADATYRYFTPGSGRAADSPARSEAAGPKILDARANDAG